MAIAGSDRIFASALIVASVYRTFTPTEIEKVIKDRYGEDAPSRRTIYTHLDALAELGILERVGHRSTLRRYKFIEEFDPSE